MTNGGNRMCARVMGHGGDYRTDMHPDWPKQ